MKFRLSTAIVMMLVAAVLLWLNVRERYSDIQPIDFDGVSVEYGFPFAACYDVRLRIISDDNVNWKSIPDIFAWQRMNLGLNIVIFIVATIGIGFLLERVIRRRLN